MMIKRFATCFWGLCPVVLLLLSGLPAQAQTHKELSLSTSYDNNAFGDYSGQGDYITQLNGMASWWYGSGRSQAQVYVSGDGYLFSQTSDRSFAVNGLGLLYVRKLGQSNNRLYAGTFASVRLDRSTYQAYDYVGLKNYVTLKWYLQPSLMMRTGYTVQLRNHWHLATSGYADHYVFAQVNKFFPTKTTLRGDVSFGFKHHGKSEGQVVMGIQVAQSLSENTGLSLRYQNRLNTHAGFSNEDVLFQDADILNDRYDYSGHEWTARLTQQLPNRMRVIAEGGYEIRNYQALTTLSSLDLTFDLNELRKDRSPYFSLTFEAPLSDRVGTRLVYDFERNQSTDIYYDYKERHSFSVNFDFDF